jgi:C4-dicarboxylate-specific signal transduction histidine kinase
LSATATASVSARTSIPKNRTFLKQARDELEVEVQARTEELTQLNTEYKTILDAAPFGIALFGPDRVVRGCNPT